MTSLEGLGCCLGAAALYLLGLGCDEDAEVLKSVRRVDRLNGLAQLLEGERVSPLVVAISGRVSSDTPIKCELSGLLGVIVEETADQQFLKQDKEGKWIRDSELMHSMRKSVPWFLDDGTGRAFVVGAQRASDFYLPVLSEGLEEPDRSLMHGTLDYHVGLKMLGVKRIERGLCTGTSLTVVGEAVKDDIGTITIRRPRNGPFYVSSRTVDQLISDLGGWARNAEVLKSVRRVNRLRELAQLLEGERVSPLVVAISGRVSSDTPIKCELSGLLGVIVEETADQQFLKQDKEGKWIRDSELMHSMSKSVPWFLDDGTGRAFVVGAQSASDFYLPILSEGLEEPGRSLMRGTLDYHVGRSLMRGTLDYHVGLKMLGVKRIERGLRTGTSLTVVGEAVKDDIGTITIRRPRNGPFYVSSRTVDELISDLGGRARLGHIWFVSRLKPCYSLSHGDMKSASLQIAEKVRPYVLLCSMLFATNKLSTVSSAN